MKNCDKNFSDNVQWSSKHLQKKTCAEIQSDVKQQQIKKLVLYLITFYRSTYLLKNWNKT